MTQKYYAHSLEGKPFSEWQPLDEHLRNVAEMAQSFAKDFGADEWAYLAGLLHDVGKYSAAFQKRLGVDMDSNAHIEKVAGRPDHSTAGAKLATTFLKDKGKGKILAYAIAGHHAGLPNGKSNDRSCLIERLNKDVHDYSACPQSILNIREPDVLPFNPDPKRMGFQCSFFIRMIYSCLVDADFLDTEKFMDKEKASWRKGYPPLTSLNEKLTSHIRELSAKARPGQINKHRADILQHCLKAAENPRGLFSLTVPTGGGKTLSSLAFALKHALKYKLSRIIYVIPYTSIIEQNAAVFRKILGKDAVLEHHSNFEPKQEDRRSRLASENWDAPLIITTNVQFFESLFGRKSSRCRKIHNIANSVVILDEAQMLPVRLLKPCIEVLKELSSVYGTSIVLCTATQPALSEREDFRDGLKDVDEIIPEPRVLYKAFKRVRTEKLGELSDDNLADMLRKEDKVLCVVNTRKHARLVFEKIKEQEGSFHLSALMCPAHRTEKFKQIREALYKNRQCRVISTQLIEAGVDIDFPVVFRSAAGLDSIAQAAGRCNREGDLSEPGQVYIFSPEAGLPPGHFRQNAQTAEMVMHHHDDPLSLAAVDEYFRTLYWAKGEKLDEYQILNDLDEGKFKGDFPFRTAAKKFKIIKDNMKSLIIPWNEDAEKLIRSLRHSKYPAPFARKLQRFTIQIFPEVLNSLTAGVECLHDQYHVLTNRDLYRDDLGLCPENPTFHEFESLFA
ncbi:CRISPR-associated helicase Cas3' [Desulfonema magnum]|uniref:CRISPR-associated helicase, Cas3-like n=1 Tax=Desulfonema magnum TaxID=45655 RepID=A0A975BY05_9BACT|nr:CRISPR-associated helicase Cas3' [Desulfonema magnum]QTA93788.1 CRISPR-associated helicase, Cas3-like [Desulfonema magnum]